MIDFNRAASRRRCLSRSHTIEANSHVMSLTGVGGYLSQSTTHRIHALAGSTEVDAAENEAVESERVVSGRAAIVCGRSPVIYYVIKYGQWRFVAVDDRHVFIHRLAVGRGHFIKPLCTGAAQRRYA